MRPSLSTSLLRKSVLQVANNPKEELSTEATNLASLVEVVFTMAVVYLHHQYYWQALHIHFSGLRKQ